MNEYIILIDGEKEVRYEYRAGADEQEILKAYAHENYTSTLRLKVVGG